MAIFEEVQPSICKKTAVDGFVVISGDATVAGRASSFIMQTPRMLPIKCGQSLSPSLPLSLSPSLSVSSLALAGYVWRLVAI